MSTAPSTEELFVQSWRLEERGDFRAAFECLRTAARLGDDGSQVNLGNYYANGTGVRKDLNKAVYWYARAYRNGASAGAYNLALLHRKRRKLKSAILWFRKAAAMNDGTAILELAKLASRQENGVTKATLLLKSVLELDREHASEDDLEEAAALLLTIQNRQRRRR